MIDPRFRSPVRAPSRRLLSCCSVLLLMGCSGSPEVYVDPGADAEVPFVVTRGTGQVRPDCPPAVPCSGGGNVREVLCGEITSEDGSVWALPGPVSEGAPAVDLFNECTGDGHNPDHESQLSTKVIDAEGTEITAALFGDNYFEFYANGQFVGRDAVAFTPFNSHVARFQVKYPVTYAALLVDWEGYLGVGLEDTRSRFHIGDGGFIGAFSDGSATDDGWKCRAFYVAPLDNPACVVLDESGNPDSSSCPSTDESVSCVSHDPETTCRAAHFPLPDDWMSPAYDDSAWPPAATYTADAVTRSPGFRDYEDTFFEGAQFIWSNNLNLDNLVVCRATIASPPEPGD